MRRRFSSDDIEARCARKEGDQPHGNCSVVYISQFSAGQCRDQKRQSLGGIFRRHSAQNAGFSPGIEIGSRQCREHAQEPSLTVLLDRCIEKCVELRPGLSERDGSGHFNHRVVASIERSHRPKRGTLNSDTYLNRGPRALFIARIHEKALPRSSSIRRQKYMFRDISI